MGTGIGIFFIAAGAILAFAVHTVVNGIDINTVGVILMLVGGLGILVDLILFAPRRRSGAVYDDGSSVVTQAAPVTERVVTRRY